MNDERIRAIVSATLAAVVVIVPGLHDLIDPEAVAAAVAVISATIHSVWHYLRK